MGCKPIYKPMLEKLKVGEFLSFNTQDQATACVHAAKKMGITVRQAFVKQELMSYTVTRIRKPRKK